MILIDANILLYATDSRSRFHSAARPWLETVLSGPEFVCLSWIGILAFLRIATDPRLQAEPLLMTHAVAIVQGWLGQSNVGVLAPGERHWGILTGLLDRAQIRGALVTDAHLAALAIEHGATLCTNDRDFSRFPGLRVVYPLAAQS